MRKLHCPICASEIEQRSMTFACVRSGGPNSKLGYAIRRAVEAANAPKHPIRKAPEWAPYLWCPNCTAAMDDYDERGRELRCPECGLSFPSVHQVELLEGKEHHTRPSEYEW